jgi:membrane protease YdiL (CAAX protease family)
MARKRTEWILYGSGKSYLDRVHQPLQCLIFITPFLLFYQIASAIHPLQGHPLGQAPQVEAFVLMLQFFGLFGVAGSYFPLLAVVAILLFWHLARKDRWNFDPKLYLGMAGESIVWAIPMFVIGLAVMRHTAPQALAWIPALAGHAAAGGSGGGGGTLSLHSQIVLSVGAGVYEELLFRLIAITALNIILVDIFQMKIQAAIPIIIVASAILFSAYHYLGPEQFNMGFFALRTGMGIYLAGIYIYRGFGIAVGTHAVYDLIVTALHH